jgi:hypothetical protein
MDARQHRPAVLIGYGPVVVRVTAVVGEHADYAVQFSQGGGRDENWILHQEPLHAFRACRRCQ